MNKLITQAEELCKKAAELLEAAEKLEKKVKSEKLPIPEIGEVIEIAGMEWIILDETPNGFMALAKNRVKSMGFGKDNDWRKSDIRTYLNNEFRRTIEDKIGCTLPYMTRDLLSMDGQTEYGECADTISILTFDEYRKYRRYIPNAGYGWWTCTPDTTSNNGYSEGIRCVDSRGRIDCYWCCGVDGVRPFCIFPSEIFK